MKTNAFASSVAFVAMACAVPAVLAQSTDFRFGSAIPASQAERTITIDAKTPWANVREGESIRFVAGPSEFGWKFDGTRSAIELMRIAPAGMLAHPLTVYVAPSAQGRRSN